MSNVYIDGVDKTSTVSGSLDKWFTKKTIEFTSEARTVAVFGGDYERGCKNGGFAMKCTSSHPDWNKLTTDLTTDNVWKVKGSADVESDVNKVCPSNWARPEYDDSTWENAIPGSNNNPQKVVGVPGICGSGISWCFRKTVGRKTHYHFSPAHYFIYLPFECDLFREICFEKLILDIPCEWDEWVIGHCSAECGVGTRTNTRVKRVEELNGGTCTGQPEEIEECMDKECPGEKDAYPCDIETGLSSYRTINNHLVTPCINIILM